MILCLNKKLNSEISTKQLLLYYHDHLCILLKDLTTQSYPQIMWKNSSCYTFGLELGTILLKYQIYPPWVSTNVEFLSRNDYKNRLCSVQESCIDWKLVNLLLSTKSYVASLSRSILDKPMQLAKVGAYREPFLHPTYTATMLAKLVLFCT